MKRKYGLVGYPLGHSFSRSFFQQKFEDEHINATYENFEIQDISCLRQLISDNHELCGLNVTIPHKTTVIPLLDELHPLAREIGAVNVIKITRQGDKIFLKGFNSDIIGFTNSIAPLLDDHMTKALILGTGGASKAIHAGLKALHITPTFVSRQKRGKRYAVRMEKNSTVAMMTILTETCWLRFWVLKEALPQKRLLRRIRNDY